MREVVITGLGLVSPIGVENADFFRALCEGRSDIGVLDELRETPLASRIGARVGEFNAKEHVKPRKNIKVMSHDIQMGFVAADRAWIDSGARDGAIDPERLGVVFGADLIAVDLVELERAYRRCRRVFRRSALGPAAMDEMFPLWMLKYFPTCRPATWDRARQAANNSVTVERASGLTALAGRSASSSAARPTR